MSTSPIRPGLFRFVLLTTAAVTLCVARPQHSFGEEMESGGGGGGSGGSGGSRNLVENGDVGGMSSLQLQLLAQQLSDYNNVPQLPMMAWDRILRTPEIKRQNRYRQCYFNPVSCFRK